MFGASGNAEVGKFIVTVVNNRNLTPEEWADRATKRIIHVSKDSIPEARAQAEAFENQIRRVITNYITMALQEQESKFKMDLLKQV